MSHVDDGRLHAYLDGGLESPEERLRVEDHLQVCPDCQTRLEAARGDREGASEILGLLGPEEVRTPPFEELLARRRSDPGAGGAAAGAHGTPSSPSVDPDAPRSRTPGASRMTRLAWAATVVLALGGGWVARGALMSGAWVEGERTEVAPGAATDSPDPGPPPPVVAQAPAPPEASRDTPPERMEDVPPADRAEVAGVVGREEVNVEEGTWTPVSPAEAAGFLGHPPLELEALPWATMDVSTVQGDVVLRTTHHLEDGTLVELLQGRGARPGDAAPVDAPAADALTTDAPAAEARAAGARAEAPAAGAPVPALLSARREGIDLLLRGAVEPEVLEGLLRRVR